ncbi:apolipoprotein N-acyltransferase [Pacificibacter sp. AS14]|uniref:apolipoprotein N-acyltransferase n=1 Tax=Pacificibacter sp. AS14 TaxID=3135785 RepID=UPI00317A7950
MSLAQRLYGAVRAQRCIAFLAGLTGGLGQAPLQAWPIALIGLSIGAYLFVGAKTPRESAALGWWLGFGTFLSSIFWIAEPFLVEPARHGWMIPFALFGMAGGLALFWSAAFYCSKRFGAGLLTLTVFWSLAELLRGYLFTGFPWALPAYIWLDTPVAQLAAFVGPYGLTALTFGLAALFAHACLVRTLRAALIPVLGFAALLGLGAWHLNSPVPQDTPHSLRIVQPNATQHLKWDPAYIPIFFERALDLSAPEGADLVIWPETSIPTPLYAAETYLELVAERSGAATAVVGLQRVEGFQGYNSAAVIGANGTVEAIYDKRHLVPFGEYMPLPKLMTAIGLRTFTAQAGFGFSAGQDEMLFDFGALGKALPLICYEAIFPRDARSVERPDWLLQITNDAWFGTLTGPQQSLAQARFRAIETGLPMVRAANTGISAITDARGRIQAFIPLGQAGAVTAALPAALPPTFYARFGEQGVFGFLSLLALSTYLLPLGRRSRKTV